MIQFDVTLKKYVVVLDGTVVGTFTTFAAALKHLRLLNN